MIKPHFSTKFQTLHLVYILQITQKFRNEHLIFKRCTYSFDEIPKIQSKI